MSGNGSSNNGAPKDSAKSTLSQEEVLKLFNDIIKDKRIEAAAALTPALNDEAAASIQDTGGRLLELKEHIKIPITDPNNLVNDAYFSNKQFLSKDKFNLWAKNLYQVFNTDISEALHVNLGAPPTPIQPVLPVTPVVSESQPVSSNTTPTATNLPPTPPTRMPPLFAAVLKDDSIGKEIPNTENDPQKSRVNAAGKTLAKFKDAIIENNKQKQAMFELEQGQKKQPIPADAYERLHKQLEKEIDIFTVDGKKLPLQEFTVQLSRTHKVYNEEKRKLKMSNPDQNNSNEQETPLNNTTSSELAALSSKLAVYDKALKDFKTANNIDLRKDTDELIRAQRELDGLKKEATNEEKASFTLKRDEAFKKYSENDQKLKAFKAEIKDPNGAITESIDQEKAQELRSQIEILKVKNEIKDLTIDEAMARKSKIERRLDVLNNNLEKYNDGFEGFNTQITEQIKLNREKIEVKDKELDTLKDLGEEVLQPKIAMRDALVKQVENDQKKLAAFNLEIKSPDGKKVIDVMDQQKAEEMQNEIIRLSAEHKALRDHIIIAPDSSNRTHRTNVGEENSAETTQQKDPAFDLINYKDDIKKHADNNRWKTEITADSVKLSDPTRPGHLTTVTKTGVRTTSSKEEDLRKDAALFAALTIKSGRSTDIKDIEISGPQESLLKRLYIEERDKLLKQESQFKSKPPKPEPPANGGNDPSPPTNNSPSSLRPGGRREE